MKHFQPIIISLWIILIILSCVWNLYSAAKNHNDLLLGTGQTVFNQIEIMREWNAGYNGVYTPVTENNQPNPYLDDPERDIKINESLTLTKINPSYMTRQISEIEGRENSLLMKITSLDPIRQENKANDIEKTALELFEGGEERYSSRTVVDGKDYFFYMEPLVTTENCLACHEIQGYKTGDIRGGIAVYLPWQPQKQLPVIILMHLILGISGIAGLQFLGRKLAAAYELIHKQALIDALTEVPNRRSFSEYLLKEFNRSRRFKTKLSLIMCDIDHFKLYNDTFGHVKGDEVLKLIAHTIQSTSRRSEDFCARYGGEEFVAILPGTDLPGALYLAEEIRKNIEDLKIILNNEKEIRYVTISIGVAHCKAAEIGNTTCEQLVIAADKALYLAKKNGRNRVESE